MHADAVDEAALIVCVGPILSLHNHCYCNDKSGFREAEVRLRRPVAVVTATSSREAVGDAMMSCLRISRIGTERCGQRRDGTAANRLELWSMHSYNCISCMYLLCIAPVAYLIISDTGQPLEPSTCAAYRN